MKLPLLSLCLALAATAPAADSDQDRARRALETGAILPLSRILAVVEADTPGRVIEVELEEEDGRLVYEIELVTEDGRLAELEVAAGSGEILDRDYEDED
ncbi:PepSY domain-containing protein [Poseidonocella sp. HB161398]|uniref:PepSY domain-containing protein n=1 Tax=Poseidonocella sp. HB161398 TaxID=2320855 RepID=UPI00110809F8|nr:PepSY domain-containing protein [Poseidonocella sp. HB161398]